MKQITLAIRIFLICGIFSTAIAQTAPTFTDCSATPIIQVNDAGTCDAIVTFATPTPDDPDGTATFTVTQIEGPVSGSTFPVGDTTVTFEATGDPDGVATCTFTVTVTDSEMPVANCVVPFSVTLDGDGLATITPADINDGSTDNCPDPTLAIDITTFDCSNLGDNTVTLTVTDAAGNADICTTTVTVLSGALDITCPANIVLNLSDNISPVSPTSVTSSFTAVFGSSLTNTFNGSGLSATDDFTATHAGTVPANSFIGGGTSGIVDFNLGSVQNINGIYLWNQNAGGPGAAGSSGIQDVIISSSTDGSTFTPIPGAISTFAQVIVSEDAPVQASTFDPIDASIIRIEVLNNYGDGNTGIGEILFSSVVDGCGAIINYDAPVVSINCDNATPTVTQTVGFASGNPFPIGTTTNTFQVDDGNGNIETCSFTVTINDDIAPEPVCQDITVQLDATGNATIVAADIDNGSIDNCGVDTLSLDITTFDCANLGENTVTLTATDASGNSATCTAVVTVENTVIPTPVCQPITITLDDTGVATIIASDIDNGSTVACGTPILSADITEFTCENLGDNTVTLTVTDDQGNTATCEAIVTVESNSVTTITCPANIDLLLSAVATPIIPSSANASFTTAFGTSLNNTFNGTGLTTFPDLNSDHSSSGVTNSWIGEGTSGTINFNLGGSQTISGFSFWNQNNGGPGAGGTSGIQNVIVSSSTNGTDFTPIPGGPTVFAQVTGDGPVAPEVFSFTPIVASTIRIEVIDNYGDGNTAFAEIAFSDDTPGCGAIVAYVTPFSNAACNGGGEVTQTAGLPSGSAFPLGLTTNTFEVADGSGGTLTCSFTVNITDDVAPDVLCQNIEVTLDAIGNATIVAADVDNGTTDNCGDVTLSIDTDTFTCADVGTPVTITLTAEDVNGNVSSCEAIVTVLSDELPAAVCQDITVQLVDGMVSILPADIDNGSGSTCGSAVELSIDVMDFTCENLGENTVTLTVTDASGNTDTCTAIVTVENNEPLVITCPADIVINLSDVATPIIPNSASTSFTTAFGSNLNNTFNGTGLDTFPSLESDHAPSGTTNSWIGEGTTGSIDFSLGGVTTVSGLAFWNQNGGGPGANGTSGIQNVIISSSTNGTDFTVIPGSPSTFTQVTANAASAPEIFNWTPVMASTIRIEVQSNYGDGNTAFAEIAFSDTTSGCGAVVNYEGPFTNQECFPGSTLTQTAGFASGSAFPLGTTTNTFVVDDGAGGTITCSFDVTITDDVAPDVICQNISVELDAAGNAVITAADVDGGTTDNCGDVTLSIDVDTFTCADVGTPVTVTLTATDVNGNTSTCEALVTVTSNELPTAVCQDITVQLVDGLVTILPSDIDNGSGSTCGTAPELSLDITEFTCENLGENTVTLTVTDASGNTDTCTAIVTVENNEPLVITCPADIVINLSDVATPIIPNSATTSFTTAFGSNLNNTFNGTGLDTFPSLESDHAPSGTTNSWIGEGTTGSIDFSLGGVTTVSGLAFWNQNGGGPGANGTSGIQNVIISSSTNGTDFTVIPGSPTTFTQVTANAASAPEVFNWTPVMASTIRIEVQSNYGDGNTAFAEIAFSDTTSGCGAVVNYEGPFTNQECFPGSTLTQTAGFASGSAFPLGTTTNTFVVDDGAGGTITCSFDVTITDDVAPDVMCQDISVELDAAGNAVITAADVDGGTTDNCGDVTLSIDVDTFTCADVGTPVTVTLTATDVNGNTSTCEALVTVTSNELPTAVCQDITVQLVDGLVTILPSDIDNGSGSTCGTAPELSLDITEFTCENLGENTVTLTVTDASGNTDTCTAIVTVENNEPLVITCPADIVINLSDVATPIIPNSASTTFTTAFGSNLNNTFNGTGLDTFPSLESDHAPSGTTNSWIGEGTTGSIDFSLGGVTTVSGLAFWNQNGGGPGANGTSGIQNIIISSSTNGTDFTPIPGAPSTFTQVTANSASAPEVFNWTPVMASTIRIEVQSNYGDGNTAFAEIAFSDTTSGCGAVVNYEGPFTNQECFPGSTLTQTAGFASGSAFPLGTTTNTFVVDDGAGGTITCSFDVTITDDVAPDVVCQDISVELDAAGNAVITAADVDGGTTDNCGDVTLSIDVDTFTCADVGTPVTVTLTATDVNGNTSTCEALVTVTSNELPTAVCQDITVQLVDGLVTILPSDIDNGSGSTCGTAPELSLDITEFTCENLGENTVTLTVTDASGNTDTCTAIVTVENNEPLVITCPADIVINLSDVATPIIPNSATTSFTTAFGSNLNNTFNGTGLDTFPSLESDHAPSGTTNSWIGEGTTGSIDFSLGGVTTVSGLAFWNQNGGGPGANGTSGIQNVIISSSTNGTDFTPIPGSPTTFTQVTANAASAPEVFNWTPVMASTIRIEVQSNYGDGNTAFAEIAFSDTTSGCGAVVNYEGPFTNQECFPGSTLTQTAGFTSGSAFPLGTTTNTFVVDDGAGGTITCSFDVTITDDVAPDVVCQDISVELDAAGNAVITAADVDGGTTDNCGDVTLSIDVDTFTCADVGTPVTVTLTATDVNGNTSTCEALVTVTSNELPTAVCQDITVQLVDGLVTILPSDIDNGSGSTCGTAPELSLDITEFTCENLGENTVTLTVTDASGNTDTCTAIVTVENNEPLVITCPADIVINLSDVATPIIPNSASTTFTTAFGSNLNNTFNGTGLDTFPSLESDHAPSGTTNSWIGEGTTGSIDFSLGGVTTVSGLAFWNQNGGGPGANGTSGIQNVIISSSTNGTDFTVIPGSPTTFTQVTANAASAPEVFNWTPVMASTIRIEVQSNYGDGNTAFAEIAFSDTTSGCGAVVNYEGPFTNQECFPGSTLTQTAGFASGSAFPLGTTTNTFVVDDGAGGTITCSFDVTITDDVAPDVMCQNITIQLDETGSASIVAADVDGGTTDNCTDVTLSIDLDKFGCANVGENIVTLTATDGNGNTSFCEAIVTIENPNIPVAICQNITLELDASGIGTLDPMLLDGGSTFVCGPLTFESDITEFTCENLGENTVILTVTDPQGNSATCEAIVTVVNNEPVTITCPDDIVLNLSEVLEPVTVTSTTTTFSPAFGSAITNATNGTGLSTSPSTTASHDATTPSNSFIGTGTSGSFDFNLGSETLISGFSFWNQNGGGPGPDGTSGIQNVVMSYSTDGTTFLPIPGAPSLFAQVTANEASAPEIFTFDQISASTIRMEVTSNYGDGNTAFAEIVFADTASGCGALVTYEGPFTNALCAGGGELVQTAGFASGSPFPLGTTTNTFEVTDGAGNVQTCSFDVTLIDDVAPRAVCQNIILQVDDTGSVTITPEQVDGGSTDNCGDITLSIDIDTFTCSNVGDNTVILTVTDSNGLIATCEAIVTIEGNTAPTAICQDITVLLDADGMATITPDQIDGGSFASCGTFTLSTDISTFTCDNLGENIVTLTATDDVGNSTSCEAIVTIENNEPLNLTCPDDLIINLSDVLEPVIPNSVSTTFNTAFSSNIQNTINGNGLDVSPSLSANHTGSNADNAFIGSGTTGTFDFDFGTERTITGFSFWNLNGGGPGANGSSGIQNVSISSSTDGVTFTPIDGAPGVFAQAVSITELAPETFSFTQISASIIRFEVTSNYGDSNTGFAEIAFSDTTVGCGAAVAYEGPFTNIECLGGGDLIQTAGFASGSIFPLGTTTNTFEVTDINGTTLTCSFDITITDDVAPRAVCQDITIQLDETGSASIVATDVDGGSTDNCGDVTIAIDIDKFGCENIGENIVTLTVTDSNGLTSTCEAIVTIENPNIPVAVCQEVTLELDATGVGILDPMLLDGGSTFVCGPLTFEADITEFTCDNLGENTVVLTVTDPSGNTATCETIVTVVNNEPVTITCPDDIVLNLSEVLEPAPISSTTTSFSPAFGSEIANATNGTGLSTSPSTTANHDPTTPSNSFIGTGTSGTFDFNLGSETLISGLSFWNQNGGGPGVDGTSGIQNITLLYSTDGTTFTPIVGAPTVFAQVTANEASAPEIFTFDQIAATVIRMEVESNYGDGNTAFAEIVFADTASGCGALVTYEGPFTNALCAGGGELVQTAGFASGSPFPLGTTTNTFEVTDGAGNVQTCSFDITIIDDVAPRAVCQPLTLQIGEDGTVTITAEDIDGGSTDNCGDITLSIDNDTFTCADVGENIVILTVTDSNGLTSTCEAIVTIESDTPPTAVCMDITIQLDEDGMATITPDQVDGGSFSSCGTFMLSTDISTFTCDNLGENIVILTATDENGQSTTCEAIVTVENTQPLNIECPDDIVLNLSEVLSPVAVSSATTSFSPAFGSSLINSFNGNGLDTSPSLDANHAGSTTDNSFIGTGSSGVIDFDLGSEEIINGFSIWNQNGGGPGANGTSGIQNVSILSSVDNVTFTVIPDSPTVFAQVTTADPVGPEVFAFTQISARYIRLDVQSNYGDGNTGLAEIAFADVTDGCGAIINYEGPFDNVDCLGGGTVEQTAGFASGSPFPIGTTTNTFVATDLNGNQVTCSFTVTLTDDVAPRAVCEAIIVVLDENGVATITPDDLDGGSSDNCGDITTSIDIDTFTCDNLGENTVTLTVTDANGNSSSCEAIVTVETNIAPTAVCQNISVELDETGMISVDPVLVDGGSTAICGDLTYELDVFEFTCDNLGENNVILTVTDEQGLTATCEAIITVINNQPIQITCPEDIMVNLSEVSNPIVPTGATATFNDAFGSALANAINGTGLTVSPSLSADHEPTNPDNSWIGEGSTGTIDFDLGSEQTVSGFSFWNQNGGGPGPDGTSGIRDVIVSASIDGTTFTPIDGAPAVFAQAVNNAPSAPEVFSFTPITATTIRFKVLNNYGDGNTAFAEVVFSDAASGCGAIISYEGPFTNENCVGGGTVTQTAGFASGNPFPVGTTTNTFTVEDQNGTIETCSFTITIVDDLAPRMVCQNIEVALDDTGAATITAADVDGGTADNCTGVTLSIDIDSFTCENLGENVVTLTATDENGNTATCEAIVTITSSALPEITCQDITIELDENGIAMIVAADVLADATSACVVDNVTLDISEFGCANTGPNVVIVTATDNAGNTATCEAIVTVVDVTAPTPECMDATISLDENGIAILTPSDVIGNLVPVQGIPFTGDGVPQSIPTTGTGGANCAGGPTESVAAVDLTGTIGTEYRIATVVVDLDHSFVGDLDLTLISPLGTQIDLSSGNGGNAQGYENATFDDAGDDITIAAAPLNGIYAPEGGLFEDVFAGEEVNGNWTLSICDNAQGDTGELLRFEINFADPDDELLGVPDNCTPTSDIVFDVDTFDCSSIGGNVVNITVTDAKGNIATCTVNVTVVDEAAPTALCQSIVVILDEETGTASITPEMIDNGSFDNCGDAITLSLDVTEFGCEDVGENIVILTVTDANGNVGTCEAVVLVDADEFGLISCQDDFTVEADLFNLYEIESYIDSLTDNCGGGIFTNVTQQPVAGTIIDAPQEVPVTLTGFDEDGNEVICEFTITVTSNPLSVDDLSLRESDLLLYPNPTAGDVTLKNLTNRVLDYMIITDIRGRFIERLELNNSGINTTFSLSQYEAGVYFMHIVAGETKLVKRVIRE